MNQREKAQQARRTAFLAAYRECGNITSAAEAAKVSRGRHYEWLEKDADYPALFAEAHEQACERLEEEARRRAIDGVDEPVFYQGAKCGTIRRYSDVLLIFLLKAAKPDKYRESFKGEIKHAGMLVRGPDLSALTDEQLQQLEEFARTCLMK